MCSDLGSNSHCFTALKYTHPPLTSFVLAPYMVTHARPTAVLFFTVLSGPRSQKWSVRRESELLSATASNFLALYTSDTRVEDIAIFLYFHRKTIAGPISCAHLYVEATDIHMTKGCCEMDPWRRKMGLKARFSAIFLVAHSC